MATDTKTTAISSVIFLFTFLPFLFLLLATVTEPFSKHLQISQLVNSDGKVLIDMGVLGACGQVFEDLGGGRTGSRCGRKAPGWFLRTGFTLVILPEHHSHDFLLPLEDTFPLITVPIACGMIGIILMLYITAWLGGNRQWTRKLNITNFSFYVVTTLVTWVSFGMAIRIPLIANFNLKGYNDSTPLSNLAPLKARAGNATWLILTGAILLLIATVLYGIKAFRKPRTESDYHVDPSKNIESEQALRD